MIKRKIMQMSNSSFIVTIPKEWANFQELIKGESLDLDISGNDLIIKGKKEKDLEVKLNFTNLNEDLIWRHLICVYRKGATKVVIKYGSKENLQIIMKFIKDLMGWAIVRQEKDKVIIRDIIPLENTDFDDIFKRVFSLVVNLSEEVLIGIKEKDKAVLDNAPYSDYNINKFSNLCLRILNLKGSNYLRTNSLYKIISTLEEIADEYRKLAVFYVPAKLNKDLVDVFSRVNSLLKFYSDLFYSTNEKKIKLFYENADLILKDMKKFKGNNLTEMRMFATLFTILHLIKSLSEENLVLSL